MADRSPLKKDQTYDEVMEMIPWFVNGSLEDADASLVEEYAAQFSDVQAEIDRQSEMAAGVCMLELAEVDEATKARSWQHLSEQIAREQRATQTTRERTSWFSFLKGTPALAGSLAMVALLAVFFVMPDNGEFRTLTSGDGGESHVIMFQLAPGVDQSALETILAEHGLTLNGEPSENGVFRADLAKGSAPEEIAKALMLTPEIAFAAPESPQ